MLVTIVTSSMCFTNVALKQQSVIMVISVVHSSYTVVSGLWLGMNNGKSTAICKTGFQTLRADQEQSSRLF